MNKAHPMHNTDDEAARIDLTHRYLIKRNVDRAYIGSTNDLGLRLPSGHIHVDTLGEDGLGPGIKHFLGLRIRALLTEKPA